MNKKSSKSHNKNKQGRSRLVGLRWQTLVGAALLLIGLTIGGISLFISWKNQQVAAEPTSLNSNNDAKDATIHGKPVRIRVPSVNINLPVIPGYYYPASHSWSLSLDKAQWGVTSEPANNGGGATFIYGHYRKGVFLTLPKAQTGALAYVKTDNGHLFKYKLRGTKTVTPQDSSILNYKGKPILILQTCTGLWYQNRQLFIFDLVKVD